MVDVAHGGAIRFREPQIRLAAAVHFVRILSGENARDPFPEGEEHLHDRHARAGHAAQEQFVGACRREVFKVAFAVPPIVAGEVEEDEVRLFREHVAVETEHPEQRSRASDGGVDEREVRVGIGFGEPVRDEPPESGAVGLRGVGAPGERTAEKDDGEALAGAGARVEGGEGGGLGDHLRRGCRERGAYGCERAFHVREKDGEWRRWDRRPGGFKVYQTAGQKPSVNAVRLSAPLRP